MTDELTIAERVAAGGAYLDEYRPGGVDEIDLDALDLADDCGCVMGQLVIADVPHPTEGEADLSEYADEDDEDEWCWAYHAWRAGDVQPAPSLDDAEAVARGFHVGCLRVGRYAEWSALTEEWRKVIERRRGATRLREIESRLEEIRVELRAERVSMGELIELAGLAAFIDDGDVELLEPAGVPEGETGLGWSEVLRFLDAGGYDDMDAWMADSDYTRTIHGAWADEHGNYVDPRQQIAGAMEASW